MIQNNTFLSLVYSCQLSLSRQPGLLKYGAVNCVPHTSMLCHWHHLCVTFLKWKLFSLLFKIKIVQVFYLLTFKVNHKNSNKIWCKFSFLEFCRWHFVVITNVTGDFYTLELPYLVVIALYLINIHKLDPVFNWPPLVLSLIISSKFLIFLTYTKHFLLLYAGFHLWQLRIEKPKKHVAHGPMCLIGGPPSLGYSTRSVSHLTQTPGV